MLFILKTTMTNKILKEVWFFNFEDCDKSNTMLNYFYAD